VVTNSDSSVEVEVATERMASEMVLERRSFMV
jgi:hypothetical protein